MEHCAATRKLNQVNEALSYVKSDLDNLQDQDDFVMQQLLKISKTIQRVSELNRSTSRLTKRKFVDIETTSQGHCIIPASALNDMNDVETVHHQDCQTPIACLEDITSSIENMSIEDESFSSENESIETDPDEDIYSDDEFIASTRSLPNIKLSRRRPQSYFKVDRYLSDDGDS